jgi:hypothetical protein
LIGIFNGILKLYASNANNHAVQNLIARYVERMLSLSNTDG